jgi:heme/copper-type cytochrome/quinol oxidase subunit 2
LGTTTIVLKDAGFITHNFTVDELGLQIVAPAGRTAVGELTDPAPGTYQFFCSISGHREAGMVGTLIVE